MSCTSDISYIQLTSPKLAGCWIGSYPLRGYFRLEEGLAPSSRPGVQPSLLELVGNVMYGLHTVIHVTTNRTEAHAVFGTLN
jgi:hypothetical protein